MRKKVVLLFAYFLLLGTGLSAAGHKAAKIPQSVDTSINNINLCDPKSSERVISGTDIALSTGEDLPSAEFYNTDKTQVLSLIFFPGDIKNSFCEFKIRKADKKISDLRVLKNVSAFISGKKIRLGMTKNKLIGILGDQFTSEASNGKLIIKYKISDYKNSEFLQAYNMPVYYGEYKFQDDKLIEFSFGFEYP